MTNTFAIVNFADTGLTPSLGGNNEMTWIRFGFYQFDDKMNPDLIKKIEISIDVEEHMTTASSLFMNIDKNKPEVPDVQKMSLEKAIYSISKVLEYCSQKNICIVGWSVLDHFRKILDVNLKRFNIDSNKFSDLRYIDIKEFADSCIDVSKLGTSSLSTVDAYLDFDNYSLTKEKMIHAYNGAVIELYEQTNIRILTKLMRREELRSINEVHNYLNRPRILKRMTFGKHAGKTFEQIKIEDAEYLIWLSSSKEIMNKNKNLAYTLKNLNNDIVEGKQI